jgi:hypothetical protein
VIESNIFLTMLWEVVLPLATVLFLLTVDAGFETFFLEKRTAIRTGVLALALGSVYPYAVISVYCILGGCALVRMSQGRAVGMTIKEYLTAVLIPLPVVLYDGVLVLMNPDLTTGQALYASPGPLAYFLGFGVVSLLAIPGAARLLRRRRAGDCFLLAWLLVTALQIYIPRALVPFQLQLILGIQLPLTIVALSGVAVIWHALRRGRLRTLLRRPRAGMTVAVLLLLAASLTSAYHLQNVFRGIERRQLPEYMDRATKEAIEWLAANTADDTVVLSAPRTAPFIPVLANNRMYCGDYGAPTARFDEKERAIRWLFGRETAKSNRAIETFLSSNRIDYVFYDREAHAVGGEATRGQLESMTNLERVFENSAVRIYHFRR